MSEHYLKYPKKALWLDQLLDAYYLIAFFDTGMVIGFFMMYKDNPEVFHKVFINLVTYSFLDKSKHKIIIILKIFRTTENNKTD